jgi:hypothetical protein
MKAPASSLDRRSAGHDRNLQHPIALLRRPGQSPPARSRRPQAASSSPSQPALSLPRSSPCPSWGPRTCATTIRGSRPGVPGLRDRVRRPGRQHRHTLEVTAGGAHPRVPEHDRRARTGPDPDPSRHRLHRGHHSHDLPARRRPARADLRYLGQCRPDRRDGSSGCARRELHTPSAQTKPNSSTPTRANIAPHKPPIRYRRLRTFTPRAPMHKNTAGLLSLGHNQGRPRRPTPRICRYITAPARRSAGKSGFGDLRISACITG